MRKSGLDVPLDVFGAEECADTIAGAIEKMKTEDKLQNLYGK